MKQRTPILAALLAVALATGAPRLFAQCASGDILWVSDAVNANVGTGVGGGGTGAQCAARTVGGAAYNSTGSPFGIQAAFDCSCQGATIRILTGANNYDSTSASWNNRVSATKAVLISTASSDTGLIALEGWVGASTRCESFQTPGCPITVDFAGGTDNGFDLVVSVTNYSIMGIRSINAAADCWELQNLDSSAMAVVEAGGCGIDGITLPSSDEVSLLMIYSHDAVGSALLTGGNNHVLFGEFHDSAIGYNSVTTNGGVLVRGLIYDNAQGFNSSGAISDNLMFTTTVRATAADPNGSGWFGGVGSKPLAGTFGLISQDNVGRGLHNYVDTGDQITGASGRMSMFHCVYANTNIGGDITNPASPAFAQVRNTPNTTDVATFASLTNFTASGVSTCVYTWPGSDTIMESCPGASPGCAGGGLFIQSVR